MRKRYMTASNIKQIEQRLDNATSELWNALEFYSDMDFSKLEDERDLRSIQQEMNRVSIFFENIVSVKNHFEELREKLETSKTP